MHLRSARFRPKRSSFPGSSDIGRRGRRRTRSHRGRRASRFRSFTWVRLGGGSIALYHASRYPNDVAGVALLDVAQDDPKEGAKTFPGAKRGERRTPRQRRRRPTKAAPATARARRHPAPGHHRSGGAGECREKPVGLAEAVVRRSADDALRRAQPRGRKQRRCCRGDSSASRRDRGLDRPRVLAPDKPPTDPAIPLRRCEATPAGNGEGAWRSPGLLAARRGQLVGGRCRASCSRPSRCWCLARIAFLSPHDLRHRRVSLLHLGGMPWARIGELVGHDDLVTTARTSTHVIGDEAELDYPAILT